MNKNKLNLLATKYWEGHTDENEERQLREALRSDIVPEGLESLAEYFNYTEQANQIVLSDDFDEHILKSINEEPTKVLRLPLAMKVAAAVILLFMSTFIFNSLNKGQLTAEQTEFIDTYDNPEEAYREVKKAMMMVSKNMNEGVEYTSMLGEFDRVTSTPISK